MSYKGVWAAGAPLGTTTPAFGVRIETQPWFPDALRTVCHLAQEEQTSVRWGCRCLARETPGMQLQMWQPTGHTAGKRLFQTRPPVFTMARRGHTPVLARSVNWPIPHVLSIGAEYRTASHTQHCQSASHQLDAVQTDRHPASLFSDPWCLRAQGLWKSVAPTFLRHSFHRGGIQA